MKNLFSYAFFIISMMACNAHKQDSNLKADEDPVLKKNKQIIKDVFRQLINERNLSAIDSLYSAGLVDHSPSQGEQPGIEGFKKAVKDFVEMFPDLKVNVEETIAEADKVVTRETWKATDVKSKKELTGETVHIFILKNGKVTEEWSKGWEWLQN